MNLEPFLAVRGIRRVLVFLGLSAIIGGMLLFVAGLTGIVPEGLLKFLGQSELRSVASLTVAGCLLVAIGYGNN